MNCSMTRSVAAVLYLQFMLHVMLFPTLKILYFIAGNLCLVFSFHMRCSSVLRSLYFGIYIVIIIIIGGGGNCVNGAICNNNNKL